MSSNRDKLTKEYATDEIVVEWEPRLCFHSQNCVRSLPQVFDQSRRPWVQVDAASADEVEAAVARCPSGALRTRRVAAAAEEHGQAPPTVCASDNGPLLVSGGVRIVDADGGARGQLGRLHSWCYVEAQRSGFLRTALASPRAPCAGAQCGTT